MTRPARFPRLAAALLLALTLLPLATAPAGAVAPSLNLTVQPEYAGVAFTGDVKGLALLDEVPGGIRIGIALAGLPDGFLRVVGATARCGQVGGMTAGLGAFHGTNGSFAGVWVTTRADIVDTIASLRIIVEGTQVACRDTIHGQEGIDVCDEVPDACYGRMILPESLDRMVRAGVLLRITRHDGHAPRAIVAATGDWSVGATIIIGSASCADGGGRPLAHLAIPEGRPLRTIRLRGSLPLTAVRSYWILGGKLRGSDPTCVDTELQSLVTVNPAR